jgi:signal transduction histidine kinase
LTGYHRTLKKAIHLVFLFLESIEKRQDLSLDEKKEKAIEFIRQVRWGPENRHYFWINDLDGKMLLEPLYPQMEGKICKVFKDTYSKEIFIDFIKTSLKYKEGFVDHHGLGYDGNKSEPRISIVRLFEVWNWVVGTGIELDAAKTWEEPEVELHFLFPPLDKEYPDEAPASGI